MTKKNYKAIKRKKILAQQYINLLEIICSVLECGGSIEKAFSIAANYLEVPIQSEIKTLVNELRLGTPKEDALCNLANRLKNPYYHRATIHILISINFGASVVPSLREICGELRDLAKKEKVKTRLTVLKPLELIKTFPEISPKIYISKPSQEYLAELTTSSLEAKNFFPLLKACREGQLSVLLIGQESEQLNLFSDFFLKNEQRTPYRNVNFNEDNLWRSLFDKVTLDTPSLLVTQGYNIQSAMTGVFLIGKKIGLDREILLEMFSKNFDLILCMGSVNGQSYLATISENLGKTDGYLLSYQDIFTFRITGYDKLQRPIGYYSPTGIIPGFIKKLETQCIQIPYEIFSNQ